MGCGRAPSGVLRRLAGWDELRSSRSWMMMRGLWADGGWIDRRRRKRLIGGHQRPGCFRRFALLLVLASAIFIWRRKHRGVSFTLRSQSGSSADDPERCEGGHIRATGRLVALGDVHGDFERMVEFLQMAKLVDNELAWMGGDAVLVQTGDVFDKGAGGLRSFRLLHSLRSAAAAAGGCVVLMVGNHEIMNMIGKPMWAVSNNETGEFGGSAAREAAFASDGEVGREVRRARIVAVVEQASTKTLFAHAGLRAWVVSRFGGDADAINLAYRAGVGKSQVDAFRFLSDFDPQNPELFTLGLGTGDGPLWTRSYAHPALRACAENEKVIDAFGAQRQVKGHDPQEAGAPSVRCWGALVLNDVGLSRHYNGAVAGFEVTAEGEARVIGRGIRPSSEERHEEDSYDIGLSSGVDINWPDDVDEGDGVEEDDIAEQQDEKQQDKSEEEEEEEEEYVKVEEEGA